MSDALIPAHLIPVKAFVEGSINGSAFAQLLYTNGALEQVLRAAPPIPPYSSSAADNLFQFLIELDLTSERDALNAQDALARLLTIMGVPYTRSDTLTRAAALRDKVQPRWLDLDEDDFHELLRAAGDRQGKALQEWLRAEVLRRFRYTKRPPRWIQNPQWPIRESVPLLFLGQLAAEGVLHDEAVVYVFMHPSSGAVETVVQVA